MKTFLFALLMSGTALAGEPAASTAPAAVPLDLTPAPLFVVVSPVADLRAEPKRVDGSAALKTPYVQDNLEESQVLYGERVKVLVDKGSWVRVEAVEQAEFTHADAWTGYPGWLMRSVLVPEPAGYSPNAVVVERYAKMTTEPSHKAEGVLLPAGARVSVTFDKDAWVRIRRPEGGDGWLERKDVKLFSELPATDDARRQSILGTASLFMREPYYWGGRAGHREDDVENPSGMDCSGLVNVAYRVAGVDVPRDAHEQYRKSQLLSSPSDLKPGDLIFLAWTKDPEKVTHVMIYAGDDDVIEAVQEQNIVRRVTVKEKLGKPLKELSVTEPVGKRIVYFGRLLPEN